MFGIILTSTAEVLLWATGKAAYGLYYGTKYLIYGHQKTENEILKEELDELKTEIRRLSTSINGEDKENEEGFVVVK